MTQSPIMSRLELNMFCLSHVLIWIEKSRSILSHESIWINTWESTWVMSWFWVNSWKAASVMNWIDSSLLETGWVMNWFESICREGTWVESPKKGHTKSTLEWKAQKRSYQVNSCVECPQKDHTKLGMNRIIQSWVDSNQDSEKKKFFESCANLNQNAESFSSRESIWIKFQKSILNRQLIWINSCKAMLTHELSRIKTFWHWVESNKKISRTHVW